MGTKFVSIASDGTTNIIGDVGGSGQVTFDYSFDYLAICSDGLLFLYDGVTLTQVTDPDLGVALDVVWVDGYFMITDGEFLVITDINDPFSVSPLNYASSEIDPDPIESVWKLRNEIYAVNRYTIEIFHNVGTAGFPFQRITGAQIQKGAVGTFASCVFMDQVIAFLGSGRNESPGIYVGVSAQVTKISSWTIDKILKSFSEADLAKTVLESRSDKGQNHLWVHLPDRTLVYDAGASALAGQPVWFVLSSGISGLSTYRGKDLVWCYDKWLIGDVSTYNHGFLSDSVSSQWGEKCLWEFSTSIVYDEGKGALFRELELVCLTGRVAADVDPYISTSYSLDGETWSQPKSRRSGRQGDRVKRIVWFGQGHMTNGRIQRFQGDSSSFMSFSRLEAQLEPLAV